VVSFEAGVFFEACVKIERKRALLRCSVQLQNFDFRRTIKALSKDRGLQAKENPSQIDSTFLVQAQVSIWISNASALFADERCKISNAFGPDLQA